MFCLKLPGEGSDRKLVTPRRPEMPPAEAGFALIEVLVSAIVVVIAAAGALGLLQAMTSAAGEQRQSSQAYAIAQEDQARLRSMQLSMLNHLDQKRLITLNGMTFTVRSTGLFINDKTATVSCAGESISADYAQVTSVVTWPGMNSEDKAVIRSIVSPSPGSLDTKNGTLVVSVNNEKKEPKPGVVLKVGALSGTTNAEGCATFPDLPAGNYNLESFGETANLVGTNSNYQEKTEAGVPVSGKKTVLLTYDQPGTIPVKFIYRVLSTGGFKETFADSVVAFHATMKAAKVVGTPGGPKLAEIKAFPLFPFTSPYSLYAGSCANNKPTTSEGEAVAMKNVVAPAGESVLPVTLQLPALDLTVNQSSKPLSGANVVITDTGCSVKRTYTTDASGKSIPVGAKEINPSLPWGTYKICADNGKVRKFANSGNSVKVQSLTSATVQTIDLGSGITSGTCP